MELSFFLICVLAGLSATYCMLVMGLWADRMKMAKLDFGKGMGMLTYGESFDGNPPYFAGQLVVYFNGAFFALFYATVAAGYLPGPDPIKGAIWGVILWFISGVFFVPVVLREGFFLSHIHKNAWFSSLVVHGIWGLVVGWIAPIAPMAGVASYNM